MRLKPITAITVLLLVVASLSVAGCTIGPATTSPTPTPTPTSTPVPAPVDYSSALTKAYESGNFIMERSFTKSTNERGNDVYKGVGRNATMPSSRSVTVVIEVTKSQNASKKVYDEAVATKLKQGYTADPTGAANYKASSPGQYDEVWMGNYGASGFMCNYGYLSTVYGSAVTEQSVASS